MEREINVSKIIDLVLKRLWIIVICITVSTAIAYVYSSFIADPTYTSVGTMYVRNVEEVRDSRVDVNEITASKTLVNTYIEILRSNSFTTKVAEDVNLDYTAAEIRDMLSMSALNNTEILQIKVRNKNARHAAIVVNSILNMADDEIIRVVKAGSVEIIDEGGVPKAPSSPNVKLNTISGAIIGAFLAMMIIVLVHIMDVSVRGEEDILERYDISVLGVIPTIKLEEV